jgi:sec-independent protein translocase protein TatA
MGPIGIPELIIVLVILLVIFGPKRLPGAGKALGTGMREFKDSLTGGGKDDDETPGDDAKTLESGPTHPAPVTTTAAAAEETREAPVSEPRA